MGVDLTDFGGCISLSLTHGFQKNRGREPGKRTGEKKNRGKKEPGKKNRGKKNRGKRNRGKRPGETNNREIMTGLSIHKLTLSR